MRFTVPSIVPPLSAEHSPEAQETSYTQSSVLRGQQTSFQEFLRQVQDNLLQNEIIDNDTVVMVSFNQELGHLVLGFIKSDPANKRTTHQPNMGLMQQAVSEYQQQQLELISSLKSGIQKFQSYRKAYDQSMQLIRSNSLPQQTLASFRKTFLPEEEELLLEKPRSLSEDTLDDPEQFQKAETSQFLQRQQKRSEVGSMSSSCIEAQSIY